MGGVRWGWVGCGWPLAAGVGRRQCAVVGLVAAAAAGPALLWVCGCVVVVIVVVRGCVGVRLAQLGGCVPTHPPPSTHRHSLTHSPTPPTPTPADCLRWDPSLWSHGDHFKVGGVVGVLAGGCCQGCAGCCLYCRCCCPAGAVVVALLLVYCCTAVLLLFYCCCAALLLLLLHF